jgi:putative phosphoesterase
MVPMRIGVISDTHGLLRPEAVAALAGVDHILHAGDVGDAAILNELRKIAPVTAIRGNVDTSGICAELPATDFIELAGKVFYLVHSVYWLDINPIVAGVAVVVSGHSHKPEIEMRGCVMYLNPGSAGPRRFKLPVTIAMVEVVRGAVTARIVEL